MALTLLPAGLFFRVGYSESLFLLLCTLTLYLIERHAKPLTVALVVGLATAARPVGVALVAPMLVYLVHVVNGRWAILGWACLCLPLSVFGLFGFMIYCYLAFGDALAFVHNMACWYMRPSPPLPDKLFSLETLEPIWSIFLPSSYAFWGRQMTVAELPFSLYVANPLYFLAAVALLALALRNRALNLYENLVAWSLLLLPYWLTGYEVYMAGMARYVSVNVPLYLVVGATLSKLWSPLAAALLGLSGFLLAAYAACFAQWYWLV